MGYSYSVLEIDYKISKPTNKSEIKALIMDSNEDSLLLGGPSKKSPLMKDAYHFFDDKEVIEELREEQLLSEAIDSCEIYDESIYWNGDSESVSIPLLQYVAWKTFSELGIGDSFICKNITHWEDDTTCSVSIVDKKGIQRYL